MNDLDDIVLDQKSFAYRDIIGRDKWDSFTPAFTSLTTVGATSFAGRFRKVGREVQFQAKFSAATSIASTAGTTYFALPVTAAGIAGIATMTDDTTNVAVGACHISVSSSRCYIPSQLASSDLFTVFGSYEV